MEHLKQQWEELEHLKAEQTLHRKQLEENRARAMEKKKQTRHLVSIGKLVYELLPDADKRTEEEIRDILTTALSHIPKKNSTQSS